jgi:hypothetical protein
MATKSTQQTNFDFATFNGLTERAPAGLKLWIAQKMLEDVQMTMLRFKSPLLQEATQLGDKIELLREKNKDYLAKRDSATGQNAYRTPDEPSTPQHSTSADAGKVS